MKAILTIMNGNLFVFSTFFFRLRQKFVQRIFTNIYWYDIRKIRPTESRVLLEGVNVYVYVLATFVSFLFF